MLQDAQALLLIITTAVGVICTIYFSIRKEKFMNHVTLIGRLVAEPLLTHSNKNPETAIVNYILAIERRFSKKEDSENNADFIRIVAFNKSAEFASKYFHKGTRVAIEGRLQSYHYKNSDDKDIFGINVVAVNQEFADSPAPVISAKETQEAVLDGFTNTDVVDDENLPF